MRCARGERPSGFDGYCRLFHPLHDGADKNDPDELANVEGNLDDAHLQRLIGILGHHTATADDCFFGLWDGFGSIHGSPAFSFLSTVGRRPPDVPPAFSPDVLAGPGVRIPAREYLLFRGPLRDAGRWGATDLSPGHPRTINSPNLVWPRDHAWFVATEIDLPWTGIAGTTSLIAELTADPVLDVEPVSLTTDVPYWRH